MKHKILIGALIILTVAVTTYLFGQTQATTQSQTFEYKFEYKCSEKKANELGMQGWELVAIESTSTARMDTNIPTYVFKRKK